MGLRSNPFQVGEDDVIPDSLEHRFNQQLEPMEHENVKASSMIQEEPPDPIALIRTSAKHIQSFIQISNSLILFVSHVLGTMIMSLVHSENIEKKIGLFKEYLGSNSYLRKEEHDKDNVMIQVATCSYVCYSMTLITHLIFAKGVDNIAGTKEELPDLKDFSSNFFARTGIGIVLTNELNMFQRIALVEMILKLEILLKALKKSFHEAAPLWRIFDHILTLSIYYPYINFVPKCFDDSNLALFVAGKIDLRSNPSQVGEDDVTLTSKETNKEQHEHEEHLEDNEEQKDQLVPEHGHHGDLEVPLGAVPLSKQAQLKTSMQHLLNTIQGSLVCANSTTLVVIPAT